MELTFLFHSGFAVETERCILIFDYWMDPTHAMERLLDSPKPIYVLSSHFHEDHFTREIFAWRERRPTLTYLLSKDILRHRRAARDEADVWLAKGATWQDERLCVHAMGSNDSGVSWIVEVEGRRLFHAGDLGNWYARYLTEGGQEEEAIDKETGKAIDPMYEEKRYLGELKDIAKHASAFDVAFLPVDGRIGNGYTRGARQFMERFRVGLLVPMHFTLSGFRSAWRMLEFTQPAGVDFWAIRSEGERRRL